MSGYNFLHENWASGLPIIMFQNYGSGNLKRLAEDHSGPPDAKGNFSIRMMVPRTAETGLITVSA